MSDEVHSDAVEGTETREEITLLAEISSSESQASISHNEVLLDIRDWGQLFTRLGQLEEELHATERQKVWSNGENRAKIKWIPEIMKRNVNVKHFTPKEWTFGPSHCYHSSYHGIKLKLTAHFIALSGNTKEVIFENFEIKMKDIRACFDKDMTSKIGDEELMRLLFLDGCAILGFIHCYMNGVLDVVGISDAQAADMEQDLLLLENQIPFRVLEVLINSQGKEYLKASLVTFIDLICRRTLPGYSAVDLCEYLEEYCFPREIDNNQKAVHLLDVFREALLFNPPSYLFGFLLTVIRGTFGILCFCGCLAICYFLERFKPEPHYNIISLFRRDMNFFPRVREIKAAGIQFKPTHSLRSTSFRTQFFFRPQLMLPTLTVDDSTASKLLNLVAYEMCLPESSPTQEFWVTSYVNLLDSLVHNEQDVKDLIKADILQNFLNSEIAVADLIKSIGSGAFTPPQDAYLGVKFQLEKHYKRKWRTKCAIWMEQVYVGYFNSPWTILALFATTSVLLLTAIQTWYAINPKK